MVALIRRRGVTDERVLRAMETVARHVFVPAPHTGGAYDDSALPIGHQQTISQPYIVALMTEALELQPGDRVLEIGTGSGYQAAVLAEMGMEVYSVERIAALYEEARDRLAAQGYTVHQKLADGYAGWPEAAPFAGIIITAAAPRIPEPLLDQLAESGRMVIPVGRRGAYQVLYKVIKEAGQTREVDLGAVAFVPFVSDALG
ncbi:MAG: protein-L-isoaspartate(D-aspartate) O-methyltransferase [Anaerolineae bacterium]|jgi:protein-L-isoaspartate(D-aspartate) O-methyltransferase|nr:protein-L-isoaspartate(D-aspartate) O-methyltransferase [Anaerolineae bacterium]